MTNENGSRLAVVGGGPGGYAAAFHAADLGMRATIIDPEKNPGGVCLFRGCIPSKALLHVMRILHEARQAKEWGVTFGEPKIDVGAMRAWKDGVVDRLTSGLGNLAQKRGVQWIRGRAAFAGPRRLAIEENGGSHELEFDHIIIATGSRPAVLAGLEPDSARVMDSTAALDIESVPERLLVIGGGYIGLELGMVYAALGSAVTAVEMTGGLLPGVDRDLVAVLEKRLKRTFKSILLETTVTEVQEEKGGLRVSLASSNGGGERAELFDKILVAVGRRPASGDLGLDRTRVERDKRGFIRVDERRCTAEPSIFAIGDVAGEPMLAHKATAEGRAAVEAILGKHVVFEPRAIPAVIFTDPELAWCGLTETEARHQGREVRAVRFPWGASGRAATLGRSDGLTKLIVDPESERVLGVGTAGVGAGELIAEGVLAVEMEARVSDVGLSIHPHPTLSETVMEAADLYHGLSTHFYRSKR